MPNKNIIIKRTEVGLRGVLRPFKWIYRLECDADPIKNDAGIVVNYEGTPLASIRRIAAKLAVSRGVDVQQDW